MAQHPPVSPASNEADWPVLLKQQWGLDLDHDLRNPQLPHADPAALFQRVRPNKPVVFTPLIALGMETPTHGGWYAAGPDAGDLPDLAGEPWREAWSYAHKQPASEQESGKYSPPPIASGSVEFDPGDQPFGLWVSNDSFQGEKVYTQPALVAHLTARLAKQPYKAMIYPCCDPATGHAVEDSYLVGWEYSTNDDFQDVVTRIDNVRLLPADPPLPGILHPNAVVAKLAGGFAFTEGPAWDANNNVLYFSDISPAHIVRYAGGTPSVANDQSGMSNGLMFDRQGMLIACEGAGEGGRRRISRAAAGQPSANIVDRYEGKRLNSPNDLWIDDAGGIYFTDPRYGPRDDMELDKEAVYYTTPDGKIIRLIDDLVRPNGIALSPDGKSLYVVDNGANSLHRYPVNGPGRIGPGTRIAHVVHPDGMTVDRQGRLYVTGREGVCVYAADGQWLGVIAVPEQPANCTFGGPDCRTLFITARTSLYAIPTLTRGWHVHLDGAP